MQNVLPLIPEDINGTIVVVQHMPANFTKSLADRLNNQSNITVKKEKKERFLREAIAILHQAVIIC